MKRIIPILVFIFAAFLLSGKPIQTKKLKLEITLEQADVIYLALGKLPAEQSESIRKYLREEYEKQFPEAKK